MGKVRSKNTINLSIFSLINMHISFTKNFAWNLLLIIFSTLTIFRFSSLGRPIWIDEFLHFAFGSATSIVDAWNMFLLSLPINHGQTGIYMMLDYFLLKAFGANTLALRAPSIFCGAWLLFVANQFIKFQGFHYIWRLVVIFALFLQVGLMYFVGEARPYMPLAASVVGVLTYYSAPYGDRKYFFIRAIGYISVFIGVCTHPYFSIYWAFIYIFSVTVLVQKK